MTNAAFARMKKRSHLHRQVFASCIAATQRCLPNRMLVPQ
jgi:hypothetical protein